MLLAKRVLDWTVAFTGLLLLAPLLLMISVAVRLSSSGPVFFRQVRLGIGGAPFQILKFRTMYTGCADLRNADGSTVSADDDPRVTPIGRLLRQSSLDELPQLWNVLRGDMSLVGPRPDQADQLRYYQGGEERKLKVRPGITGLAQIGGRNTISWSQRKRLDLEYVDNWSLAMDLTILARTVPYVLIRRGVNQKGSSCTQ